MWGTGGLGRRVYECEHQQVMSTRGHGCRGPRLPVYMFCISVYVHVALCTQHTNQKMRQHVPDCIPCGHQSAYTCVCLSAHTVNTCVQSSIHPHLHTCTHRQANVCLMAGYAVSGGPQSHGKVL